MKLIVRYFPPFDDLTGIREEEIQLSGSSIKISDFVKFLAERHGKLTSKVALESDEVLRRNLIIAVDSKIARLSDPLRDGAVLKILPPIAGG